MIHNKILLPSSPCSDDSKIVDISHLIHKLNNSNQNKYRKQTPKLSQSETELSFNTNCALSTDVHSPCSPINDFNLYNGYSSMTNTDFTDNTNTENDKEFDNESLDSSNNTETTKICQSVCDADDVLMIFDGMNDEIDTNKSVDDEETKKSQTKSKSKSKSKSKHKRKNIDDTNRYHHDQGSYNYNKQRKRQRQKQENPFTKVLKKYNV